MEAQDTLEESPPSPPLTRGAIVADSEVFNSTSSTAPTVAWGHPQLDGSVISAVTDPASLEGPAVPTAPSLLDGSEISREKLEIPEQVILPEESNESTGDCERPVSPPSEQDVVAGDAVSASASSLPDPPAAMQAKVQWEAAESDDAATAPAAATPTAATAPSGDDGDKNGGLDEYIRSPEVQNAIVERSPGGRYVRFMEKLGSGASKDVYRAYDTQEGIEVAWNVVNLSGVPKNERNRIVNEVRLLERLHHHNIISFHGSWVNRERQEVNFVTEILSSGTLKSFINKVQVIRWKIAKRWALQILKGLEYLHSQDPPVIHRDLKCDNIFINGTSGDLRIGDLGLSTVHRNGRVLSVLGTPEFMAPDMYEENSYDEKVDIYAFGMCVLEIFTKEIPYSECSNPAQIYKKVSSGEPPEVLSRLQSKYAREFVLLCLGHKDENDNYIRPTASELLKHPFLEKRENDDDEVVVDRPLRERPIAEARDRLSRDRAESGESAVSLSAATMSKRPVIQLEASTRTETTASVGDQSSEPSPTSIPPRPRSRRSINEEDGDRFEEMPESETNMKKVKVLMGRDTELKEEEEPSDNERELIPTTGPASSASLTALDPTSQSAQSPESTVAVQPLSAQPVSGTSQHSVATQLNYLVAAAVIAEENSTVRPYADDILKLVVTLPVEGQTQNVQFDFHLVEDDPVQVAKEMVMELGIPQGAVLEISETVSGLACAARMKQDKYAVRMQNSEQGQNQPQPGKQQQQTQQNESAQQPTQETSQQQGANQVQEYASAPAPASRLPAPQKQMQNEQSLHVQVPQQGSQQQVPQHLSQEPQQVSQQQRPQQGPQEAQQAPQQQMPLQISQQPSQQVAMQVSQQVPQHVPQQPPYSQTPQGTYVGTAVTVASGDARPHQTHQLQPHVANQQPQVPDQQQQAKQQAPSQQRQAQKQIPNQQQQAQHQQQMYPPPPIPTTSARHRSESSLQGGPGVSTLATNAQGSQLEPSPPDATQPGQRSATVLTTPPKRIVERAGSSASSASPLVGDDLESDEEDDLSDEIRQLDEDFQKNLQRAKKVFDNRMDNLQRSQIEREAQHQKTLEKHEKERAEFEKRLAQEAEQQSKRIEQLQREWDRRRGNLSQYKKKGVAKLNNNPNGLNHSTDSTSSLEAVPSGSSSTDREHTRDGSNVSSNLSVSPLLADRKLSKPPNGGTTER